MSFRSLCFVACIFVALVFGFLYSLAALAEEVVDPRLPAVVPVSPSGYGIPVSPVFSYQQPIPASATDVQSEIDAGMSPVFGLLPEPELHLDHLKDLQTLDSTEE